MMKKSGTFGFFPHILPKRGDLPKYGFVAIVLSNLAPIP